MLLRGFQPLLNLLKTDSWVVGLKNYNWLNVILIYTRIYISSLFLKNYSKSNKHNLSLFYLTVWFVSSQTIHVKYLFHIYMYISEIHSFLFFIRICSFKHEKIVEKGLNHIFWTKFFYEIQKISVSSIFLSLKFWYIQLFLTFWMIFNILNIFSTIFVWYLLHFVQMLT